MKLKATHLIVAPILAFGIAGNAWAEKINLGVPNWSTANVMSNVLKLVIEENLGHEVALVPSTNPIIFKAMDAGKGDIDVHPEVWMPNQGNLVDKYVTGNKTVELSAKPFDGFTAMCVTQMTAEKYGVSHINDLLSPDLSAALDSNGDGVGEMWIGATGWASTNVEKVRGRDYGYDQVLELTIMDETLAVDQLKAADAAGKPFAIICYVPHHMFGLVDLVTLEEPPYSDDAWNMVQPTDDPEWFDKSNIAVAWPKNTLHLAYAKRLESAAPDVAKLLSNVQMETDDASKWAFEMVENGREPAEIAREWVDANPDKVNSWLGL